MQRNENSCLLTRKCKLLNLKCCVVKSGGKGCLFTFWSSLQRYNNTTKHTNGSWRMLLKRVSCSTTNKNRQTPKRPDMFSNHFPVMYPPLGAKMLIHVKQVIAKHFVYEMYENCPVPFRNEKKCTVLTHHVFVSVSTLLKSRFQPQPSLQSNQSDDGFNSDSSRLTLALS